MRYDAAGSLVTRRFEIGLLRAALYMQLVIIFARRSLSRGIRPPEHGEAIVSILATHYGHDADDDYDGALPLCSRHVNTDLLACWPWMTLNYFADATTSLPIHVTCLLATWRSRVGVADDFATFIILAVPSIASFRIFNGDTRV